MENQKLLSRKEASVYLAEKGLARSPATLAKYATVGGGPAFRRYGTKQIVYSTDDLDEWVEEQLSKVVKSTAEFGSKAYLNYIK